MRPSACQAVAAHTLPQVWTTRSLFASGRRQPGRAETKWTFQRHHGACTPFYSAPDLWGALPSSTRLRTWFCWCFLHGPHGNTHIINSILQSRWRTNDDGGRLVFIKLMWLDIILYLNMEFMRFQLFLKRSRPFTALLYVHRDNKFMFIFHSVHHPFWPTESCMLC